MEKRKGGEEEEEKEEGGREIHKNKAADLDSLQSRIGGQTNRPVPVLKPNATRKRTEHSNERRRETAKKEEEEERRQRTRRRREQRAGKKDKGGGKEQDSRKIGKGIFQMEYLQSSRA